MQKFNKAFTLVELIVVITILAILGTIAFISLQGYSKNSRDSVRISDLKNIQTGLELYKTKIGKYPTPDNYVEITASGTVFIYQGVVGDSLLNKIKISNGGKDPVDQSFYTYITTSNLYQYELMGFLEGSVATIFSQANAIKYTNRLPKIIGDELGILVDASTNEQIQITGTGVDILNTLTNYKVYFSETVNITGTGGVLFPEYYSRMRSLLRNNEIAKLDSSLVGYWDLETIDINGGFKDISGHIQTGALVVGNTVNNILTKGISGKGVMMGSGWYINLGQLNNSLNNFTVSIFFKNTNSLSNGMIIRGLNYGGTWTNSFILTYNRFAIRNFSSYTPDIVEYSKVLDNVWNNLVITKTNLKIKIYNNGTLIGETVVQNPGIIQNPGVPFVLGARDVGDSAGFFNGLIDELRIYNRELSESEVRSLYLNSK